MGQRLETVTYTLEEIEEARMIDEGVPSVPEDALLGLPPKAVSIAQRPVEPKLPIREWLSESSEPSRLSPEAIRDLRENPD